MEEEDDGVKLLEKGEVCGQNKPITVHMESTAAHTAYPLYIPTNTTEAPQHFSTEYNSSFITLPLWTIHFETDQ